jgi:thiopeptide-type bacteriocin biosynthesis protein
VYRLAIDTYNPEIDRYGGVRGLQLAEQLFCIDSRATSRLLLALRGDSQDDSEASYRWAITAASIDLMCQDLGLDIHARKNLFARMREQFGREHRLQRSHERDLGSLFRQRRQLLEQLMAADDRGVRPLRDCFAILQERSVKLTAVGAALRAARESRQISLPVETLAESFVHVHVNRMLRTRARIQEMIMYDFVERTLKSRIARGLHQSSEPER